VGDIVLAIYGPEGCTTREAARENRREKGCIRTLPRSNIVRQASMEGEKIKSKPKKKAKREIRIRTMEIDDIAPVFHLGERLFTSEESPNLYRTWDEYEIVEFYSGDRELCLVAEDGKDLVGFVLATTIEKRRSAWKYGYLVWIGIDERYQGKKLGSRLFREYLALMEREGVNMLLVDIEAENVEAHRFFLKMGFQSPQNHIYLSRNLRTRDRGD
jgi:ribosomal protein S18 acetylase RimI-like enzyme